MLSHVSVSSNLFQKLFFYFEQTQYADHLVAFFRRRTFLPSASACLQLPRAGEADCSKPSSFSLLEANQGGRGEFGRVPVYLAKSTQVTLCKQQDHHHQQQQQLGSTILRNITLSLFSSSQEAAFRVAKSLIVLLFLFHEVIFLCKLV